jgi:hypothetical protein
VLWGDEEVVRERFGRGLSKLSLERVIYRFDYPFGPEQVIALFRDTYGPMTQAFAKLSPDDRALLHTELVDLWASRNRATTWDRTIVDAEYLQVVGVRA